MSEDNKNDVPEVNSDLENNQDIKDINEVETTEFKTTEPEIPKFETTESEVIVPEIPKFETTEPEITDSKVTELASNISENLDKQENLDENVVKLDDIASSNINENSLEIKEVVDNLSLNNESVNQENLNNESLAQNNLEDNQSEENKKVSLDKDSLTENISPNENSLNEDSSENSIEQSSSNEDNIEQNNSNENLENEPNQPNEPNEIEEHFIFCSQCGTKNKAEAAFCPNCGNKLKDLSAASDSVNQAQIDNETNATPNEEKTKKGFSFKKLIIPLVAICGVLLLVFVFSNILRTIGNRSGKRKEVAYVYGYDGDLYITRNLGKKGVNTDISYKEDASVSKAISDDGGKYAYVNVDRKLYKVNISSGKSDKILSGISSFQYLGGNKVLAVKNSELVLYNGKDDESILDDTALFIASADNKKVLIEDMNNTYYILDVNSSKLEPKELFEADNLVGFKGDFSRIYYIDDKELVCLTDLKDENVIHTFDKKDRKTAYADYSGGVYYVDSVVNNEYLDIGTIHYFDGKKDKEVLSNAFVGGNSDEGVIVAYTMFEGDDLEDNLDEEDDFLNDKSVKKDVQKNLKNYILDAGNKTEFKADYNLDYDILSFDVVSEKDKKVLAYKYGDSVYKVNYSKNKSEAKEFDDVEYLYGIIDGELYYISTSKLTLYIEGEKIEKNFGRLIAINNKKYLYISSGRKSDLKLLEGKKTKPVLEDINFVLILKNGGIIYFRDYSSLDDTADMYYMEKGKKEKSIQEDVTVSCCALVYNKEKTMKADRYYFSAYSDPYNVDY